MWLGRVVVFWPGHGPDKNRKQRPCWTAKDPPGQVGVQSSMPRSDRSYIYTHINDLNDFRKATMGGTPKYILIGFSIINPSSYWGTPIVGNLYCWRSQVGSLSIPPLVCHTHVFRTCVYVCVILCTYIHIYIYTYIYTYVLYTILSHTYLCRDYTYPQFSPNQVPQTLDDILPVDDSAENYKGRWCFGMKKQPLMAIEWGYKGISSWIRLTMINPFGRWSSIHYLYDFGRWFLYPFMYLGISMAWDWMDVHTPYAMTRLHMSVWVKVKDPGESLWVTQFYNA